MTDEYHPYPCERHNYVVFGVIIMLAALVAFVSFHIYSAIAARPYDCPAGEVCACVNGLTCGDGCYLENGTLIYSSAHCTERRCVKLPEEQT